jgi:hypothetical protein
MKGQRGPARGEGLAAAACSGYGGKKHTHGGAHTTYAEKLRRPVVLRASKMKDKAGGGGSKVDTRQTREAGDRIRGIPRGTDCFPFRIKQCFFTRSIWCGI